MQVNNTVYVQVIQVNEDENPRNPRDAKPFLNEILQPALNALNFKMELVPTPQDFTLNTRMPHAKYLVVVLNVGYSLGGGRYKSGHFMTPLKNARLVAEHVLGIFLFPNDNFKVCDASMQDRELRRGTLDQLELGTDEPGNCCIYYPSKFVTRPNRVPFKGTYDFCASIPDEFSPDLLKLVHYLKDNPVIKTPSLSIPSATAKASSIEKIEEVEIKKAKLKELRDQESDLQKKIAGMQLQLKAVQNEAAILEKDLKPKNWFGF